MILFLQDTTEPTRLRRHLEINSSLSSEIVVLSKDDLKRLSFADTISRTGDVALSWQIDGRSFCIGNTPLVVSSLSNFSEHDFQDFSADDRSYAAAEYNAYFAFAISQFKCVINQPASGMLAGFSRSLIFQWSWLANNENAVSIPMYFFGPASQVPASIAGSPAFIQSANIYSYGHWNPSVRPNLPDGIGLFYKRPRGRPRVVTKLNDKLLSHDLHGIDVQLRDNRILSGIDALATHLNLPLSHTLVFEDEHGDCTFAAMAPFISEPHLSDIHISFLARCLIELALCDS